MNKTHCPKNLWWYRYPDTPGGGLEEALRSINAKKLVTASQDLCFTTLGSRRSDHNSSGVAEATILFLFGGVRGVGVRG